MFSRFAHGQLSLLFITLTAGALPSAAAQSLSTLPPGTRVQLILDDSVRHSSLTPARQAILGNFVRATPDSVWLELHGAAAFSVSQRAITSARASRGVSRVRSAIMLGIGLGIETGIAVHLIRDRGRYNSGNDDLVGGGIGFGAGVLIGAIRPNERWRRLHR